MSHEANVHPVQTTILRELLFHPAAGYAKLQKPTGLSSDHFNFHIKRLLELGYVDKVERGQYRLSAKGKEYANRLDTDENTIERQPKVAVLLGIERTYRGRQQIVFQERLKNPWYGFWGIPSGKVRWGETLEEAAIREAWEETRLTVDVTLAGIYHERVVLDNSGQFQEDKLFFVMHCRHPEGKLLEKFEGGRNVWLDPAKARELSPRFQSFDVELDMLLSQEPMPNYVDRLEHYQSQAF